MVLAAVRRATAAIADKIRCFMGNLRFPPMKFDRKVQWNFAVDKKHTSPLIPAS
jgi:hypothetical protein